MNEKASFELDLSWKAFLLEQVNHPNTKQKGWTAWDDASFDSRDLPPHEAARSVRERLGTKSFEHYHRALFDAHHEQDRDITETSVLVEVADEMNLDTDSLQTDLEKGNFRQAVGEDHQQAEEEYGIFGVPTILFNDTQPIFLKLDGGDWEGTEDVELFKSIYNTAATRPHLMTMKKPSSASDLPPAEPIDFDA